MKLTLSRKIKLAKKQNPIEIILPNHASVVVGSGGLAGGGFPSGAWFITSAGGVDRLFALRDDGLLKEYSLE